MQIPPPEQIMALVIVVFFAIGLHEYAHAKFADLAGDPTPRYFGRVTLNLTKHFELMGTLMMFITMISGIGIGWGKPCPMDPRKMKNPRWDHFIAVIAGPLCNLAQAVLWAVALRVALTSGGLVQGTFPYHLLQSGVTINLALCFFNLIPIGPLDGMWILGSFMGGPAQLKWTRWNLTAGQFVFLGLVLIGQISGFSIIGLFIGPPVVLLYRFLVGSPFVM